MTLHLCAGADLPPLLHHHHEPQAGALTQPWPPVTNHDVHNKPCGGVWTSPASPINPLRSPWTDRCENVGDLDAVQWQTELHPDPDATFVVIDSAADARALHAALPNPEHMLAALALQRTTMMIDWAEVAQLGAAGVWLTAEGERATRRPKEPGTPWMDGWDVATAWFVRRAFRVGATSPYPGAPAPEVNGPGLGEALAEVKELFTRAGEEPPPWLDQWLEALP